MAGGNIKGITIQFRGETSQLDEALRKINKETKDIDTELKNVNRALKFNPNSVELWRQKQTLLNQKLAETKEKADVLRDTLKKVDSGELEMSAEEVSKLKRELIEADSKAKAFQKEIDKIGNANLKALSEQLKGIGDKMTSIGNTMTTKVTAPIVAGYTLASKYASDYEENLNKIDVAFGANSQTVKDWANTASAEFGLSKVQATDAASAFGALGKGIGLSEAEAADMSTTLAGLSADLGSYFNVGVDESAKALEGIFTGESEALKKFGVVMTDTNLQKFAEDQGLVWKEMDQTQKTMLRYQYVLAKTKDAQGDFSRTSDGTANSIKVFQATVQDLGTSIGTVLLPVITPVIQKITEWVNKFNELPAGAQQVITVVGLIVAAVGPLLVILGTLVSSIGALIGAAPLIIGAMGTFITTVAPVIAIIGALIAIGVLLYRNWDTIKLKAQELWKSITTTWNSIKASITQTVNTIISNVISKFNSLKSSVEAVWNSIKSAIVTPIQSAKDTLLGIVDTIKSWFPIRLGNLFTFKLPHIVVGSRTVKVGDKDVTVPTFDINWYAKGGIFNSPTLLAGVGEAGPEAVVPLDRFWEEIRNSNATTDRILAQQSQLLGAILEELEKEKDFKVNGMWAGRYVNSLVR